ncbi:MAG TPA: enoyl-CoA hydratase/isomerase family protein [Syntrophales bacterium]|nr:enoyl-CoA hydratase/isomerase family protein [Syntrophales bacterium]HQB30393.1 enoyl-CoA hydratase/isomerase family protein [Syntrophales bacterium]HQN76820.1 enoyl-CoA hydratase/isomerase family protein [Syntrophales bacterium]HQQ26642.1 enoyl-CoA hydratase/isomerase family protein [Syntrophales bacterium]
MGESVLYSRKGNVGFITFNRPHRLNAINEGFLDDFMDALIRAARDDEAVTVVMTGAGEKAFCAGEDLKETSSGKNFQKWITEADKLQDVQRLTLRLNKPLIGMVRGWAVGGGCEFALSCDFRIAGETAKFGFPETGIGLTITQAGTKLLTQIVGLGKAKELAFTGEFIDAAEALRIGMVNYVFPEAELEQKTLEFCEKIGKRSPLSLRLTRSAIDLGMSCSFDEILEIEAAHLMAVGGGGNEKFFLERRMQEHGMKKD